MLICAVSTLVFGLVNAPLLAAAPAPALGPSPSAAPASTEKNKTYPFVGWIVFVVLLLLVLGCWQVVKRNKCRKTEADNESVVPTIVYPNMSVSSDPRPEPDPRSVSGEPSTIIPRFLQGWNSAPRRNRMEMESLPRYVASDRNSLIAQSYIDFGCDGSNSYRHRGMRNFNSHSTLFNEGASVSSADHLYPSVPVTDDNPGSPVALPSVNASSIQPPPPAYSTTPRPRIASFNSTTVNVFTSLANPQTGPPGRTSIDGSDGPPPPYIQS